jgi:regulator of protease activity HflC (stomatin/prohibitin superfamily)
MEKILKPKSGWLMLTIGIVCLFVSVYCLLFKYVFEAIPFLLVVAFIGGGFLAIQPSTSRVLTLFGTYEGSILESGFFWTNPFYLKKNISLRAGTLEISQVKVNDKPGNPILISCVVVWRVENTYKAAFDVENYESLVRMQSETALRKIASEYSYDNFEDAEAEITLRSNTQEVNKMLQHEIAERVQIAGVEIIEARISNLSYSTEIAGAMLQRQQATAIVAARFKIVEGAVGMVELALDQLRQKEIVDLDEEKKAVMVSNLLVVLCGDRGATPVLNTGTLHQ